jgi:hypothetical protein
MIHTIANLALPVQYIFSLVNFVIKYGDFFSSNPEIHERNTFYKQNLHFPTTNLTLVQKGVSYSGIQIYNHLPNYIKSLSKDLRTLNLN